MTNQAEAVDKTSDKLREWAKASLERAMKKAEADLAPGTPATDGSATVTSTMNPGRLCMRRVVTDLSLIHI